MDPNIIGNAVLAFILIVTTLTARWSTQARAQRRELKRLRTSVELFEIYVHDLRTLLARHGFDRPDPPPGLFESLEEEEDL